MSILRHWIREVHRRSIWQVLSVYLVGSWGALQVVESITENAGLPDWVPSFALVLLVIGLPVVLATAVVQEGFAADEEDDAGKSFRPTVPNLAAGTGALDLPSTRGSFLERHLTWKRAVFGGVGAFSVLIASVGGYFGMRSAGIGPVASLVAQGVLDARDPVVLARFDNSTGDEALGELVTEALRVDLLASPVLTVVEPTFVDQVLRRMERDPSAPFDGYAAREVAIREGFKAVIEGEVGQVGSGYLLNARIVSAMDGAILAAFRRSAEDEDALLAAIDGLSQDIREKAGESLKSIKAGEPLGTVTTSSLEALRLYTRAVRTADLGDPERGVELMEEAVAADSTFAMAWRKLAALYGNIGQPEAQADSAAERAYRLRDRLSERERYSTIAYYFQRTGDREQAEAAYRSVLETHPDDQVALNNLALLQMDVGEHARALELLDRAVDGPGETALAHYNRVIALGALRRTDEAVAAADRYAERYPADARSVHARVQALLLGHRLAEARAAATAGLGRRELSERARTDLDHYVMIVDVMEGRLDDAEARLLAMVGPEPGTVEHLVGDLMQIDIVVRRDTARALALPERALREAPFAQHAPDAFSPEITVVRTALAGRGDLVEPIVRGILASPPPEMSRAQLDGNRALVDGFLAAAAGRHDEAVDRFREARRLLDCRECLLADEGLALAAAGRTDEAVETLEAWLASSDRSIERALYDPLALETLGRLHEERGDTAAALDAWRRFADLWTDADPVLQPRVRAARERIAALGG